MRAIASIQILGALVAMHWLSGCAAMTELTGFDPHWGRPVPITNQGRAYALHMAGVIHERRGELPQSMAAWKAVNKIDPEAVAPRLCLIRAWLRQGEYEQALTLCKQALEHAPERADLWIVYGELSHRAGRIEAAIRAFERAIELRPDDLAGYGALVELQESTNDLVAAIDIYERLIQRSPDSAALYYQLGVNLARIKDMAYARETFEKVLALEPRITRARFLLALVLFEQGEVARSAEEFRLYLLERPGDAAALEYRAGALARDGRLEAARQVYERLIAESGAASRQYAQLAWVMFQLGQEERAQQYALEGGAYLLADIIFTLGFLRRTPEERRSDNSWDDRYSLDEVELESDLLLSAIVGFFGTERASAGLLTMLDTLEAEVGFSISPAFLRARLLLHLERHEEALAVLDRIRATGMVAKQLHYYSAVAHEKLAQDEQVERHLRAFLESDPDDPDALNFLGYFFAERSMKLDEAEQLLDRALKLSPDNPYYMDSLGWVYYQQGRAEEAAEMIRRAIYGMDTDDAVLRDHLGDVYLLKGDVDRALAEWRRALRLDPSMNAVREKIERYEPDSEASPAADAR